MTPKFKDGQEVWMMVKNDYEPRYRTRKHTVINVFYDGNNYICNLVANNRWGVNYGYCSESDLYASEKELCDSVPDDVYLSYRECYESEWKYLEREEKLKRINEFTTF